MNRVLNGRMDERLLALLVDEATEGLHPQQHAELRLLLAEHPEVDPDGIARAAAAAYLAWRGVGGEALPAGLAARVEEQAEAFFRGGAPPQAGPEAVAAPVLELRPRARQAGWRRFGWTVAAAALVLAVAGWLPWILGRMEPGPAAQRTALMARASDVLVLEWTATEDPAAQGAGGDVVWSDGEQRGFMRFAGLAPNNPAVSQYQLWIFDKQRDERYPVDGGVFDVPAGADEVIVPIAARVPVSEAVLFAVTVEQPGGVVVSTRERLPLLAQKPG